MTSPASPLGGRSAFYRDDEPVIQSHPWHDNLGPRQVAIEQVMLRNACFVFTAALSMMRESKKQAELLLMKHSTLLMLSCIAEGCEGQT